SHRRPKPPAPPPGVRRSHVRRIPHPTRAGPLLRRPRPPDRRPALQPAHPRHRPLATLPLHPHPRMNSQYEKIFAGAENLDDFLHTLDRAGLGLPSRINADPHNVEKGLAKLVLTLIELLRQLMERQAIRRMEAGTLTDEEVERLGQ